MNRFNYIVLILLLGFGSMASAIPAIPSIPPFPTIPASNNVYHVDNVIGNDSSPGDGSPNNPWKTIQYGISNLSPGDKLIVHGTTAAYSTSQIYIARSDSGTEWITVSGEDGVNGEKVTLTGRFNFGDGTNIAHHILLENVQFEGPGNANNNIVFRPNANNIAIDNVKIDCLDDQASGSAIWTKDYVNHVWFRNVDVHECGEARDGQYDDQPVTICGGICIAEDYIDEIVFENVTSRDNTGDGIGGSSNNDSGNYYFKNVVVERNTCDGIDIAGTRAVIVDSVARENSPSQGVGFKLWTKESWVVGSVAYKNEDSGISIKPRGVGNYKAYLINNTLAKNALGKYGGQIGTAPNKPDPTGSLELHLINNILYAVNTQSIVINNYNTQLIVEENNNYFFGLHDTVNYPNYGRNDDQYAIESRNGASVRDDDLTYTFVEMQTGDWATDSGLGNNSIAVTGSLQNPANPDPGFEGASAGDVRVLASSLAVNAGVAVSGRSFDLDGTQVPLGNAPDIGAYENTDHDGDSILTVNDNCPDVYNPNQTDLDINGVGNVCDLEIAIIESEGTEDGWVRDGSNPEHSTGVTNSYALSVGDNAGNSQYKSFVSFYPSLPNGSVVNGAILELVHGANSGDTQGFGAITIDMSIGGFNGNPALENQDVSAAATLPYVGILTTSPSLTDGDVASSDLDAAAIDLLPGTGAVQFRLAFPVHDDGDSSIDRLYFYSGASDESNEKPRLILDYYLPD